MNGWKGKSMALVFSGVLTISISACGESEDVRAEREFQSLRSDLKLVETFHLQRLESAKVTARIDRTDYDLQILTSKKKKLDESYDVLAKYKNSQFAKTANIVKLELDLLAIARVATDEGMRQIAAIIKVGAFDIARASDKGYMDDIDRELKFLMDAIKVEPSRVDKVLSDAIDAVKNSGVLDSEKEIYRREIEYGVSKNRASEFELERYSSQISCFRERVDFLRKRQDSFSIIDRRVVFKNEIDFQRYSSLCGSVVLP